MHFTLTLNGQYKRVPRLDSMNITHHTSNQEYSLTEFIQQMMSLAASNYDAHIQTIHHHYGLDFLHEEQIKDLITNHVKSLVDDAGLSHLTDTSTSNTQDILERFHSILFLSRCEGYLYRNAFIKTATRPLKALSVDDYTYYFHPHAAALHEPLLIHARDRQLPESWSKDIGNTSTLLCKVDQGVCIDYPQAVINQLYDQLIEFIEHTLTPHQFIRALQNRDSESRIILYNQNPHHDTLENYFLSLSYSKDIVIHLEQQHIPKTCQILYRLFTTDQASVVKTLIEEGRTQIDWKRIYEKHFVQHVLDHHNATLLTDLHHLSNPRTTPTFWHSSSTDPHTTFHLQSQSKRMWREVIEEAKSFLFISSYIIEDEHLVQLIVKKASLLPGRIFILCNIKGDFLNYFKQLKQDDDQIDIPFKESKVRQWSCLKTLLQHPILLYHSDQVHLKCCLSEQSMLITSANITPNSLGNNIESSLYSRNQALLHHTYQEMTHHIRERGFHVYLKHQDDLKVEHCYNNQEIMSKLALIQVNTWNQHPDFRSTQKHAKLTGGLKLYTNQRFEKKLREDLKQAKSVYVMCYSFHPNSILYEYPNLSHIHIKAAKIKKSSLPKNCKHEIINSCHAKLILIDEDILYLGSSDSPRQGSNPHFFDLTLRIPIHQTPEWIESPSLRQLIISLKASSFHASYSY